MSVDQPDDDSYPLTPIQAIRSGLAWFRGSDEVCSELTPDVS